VEFVPLLEETGLIVPVGEWVLRVAGAQVQRWHASGLTQARLAVNLSPRQLLVPHLDVTVRDILAETGLAPEALELELTETAAMLDLEAVLGVLHELHAIGVTTAIDDFGVGQSWLVRLKEFPVRTLKIDRYFVAGVDRSPDGLAIVQAIVALGHALGLAIVAEGVETAGELEAIRSVGCDLVQGFLYAPALPAAELEALLAAGGPLAQAA
jgi:EAL domain-containing protein (putative c-di-GMP-specific phosphodiesterase class I)